MDDLIHQVSSRLFGRMWIDSTGSSSAGLLERLLQAESDPAASAVPCTSVSDEEQEPGGGAARAATAVGFADDLGPKESRGIAALPTAEVLFDGAATDRTRDLTAARVPSSMRSHASCGSSLRASRRSSASVLPPSLAASAHARVGPRLRRVPVLPRRPARVAVLSHVGRRRGRERV